MPQNNLDSDVTNGAKSVLECRKNEGTRKRERTKNGTRQNSGALASPPAMHPIDNKLASKEKRRLKKVAKKRESYSSYTSYYMTKRLLVYILTL